MEAVFSDMKTCRIFLEALREKGVKFIDSLDGLSQAELKTVAWRIVEELDERENIQ